MNFDDIDDITLLNQAALLLDEHYYMSNLDSREAVIFASACNSVRVAMSTLLATMKQGVA